MQGSPLLPKATLCSNLMRQDASSGLAGRYGWRQDQTVTTHHLGQFHRVRLFRGADGLGDISEKLGSNVGREDDKCTRHTVMRVAEAVYRAAGRISAITRFQIAHFTRNGGAQSTFKAVNDFFIVAVAVSGGHARPRRDNHLEHSRCGTIDGAVHEIAYFELPNSYDRLLNKLHGFPFLKLHSIWIPAKVPRFSAIEMRTLFGKVALLVCQAPE